MNESKTKRELTKSALPSVERAERVRALAQQKTQNRQNKNEKTPEKNRASTKTKPDRVKTSTHQSDRPLAAERIRNKP
jgi:hypothetical protein